MDRVLVHAVRGVAGGGAVLFAGAAALDGVEGGGGGGADGDHRRRADLSACRGTRRCWSFAYGVGFGLLPVGWTIFNAMLLYNITVETGQFTIIRRSVASLSGDARIQAILIGFSFGAFLEGAAGGGTPVAICGAIMVGLGFNPFLAAVLCLIANTSPVAYGGLGTPILVLSGVTGIAGARRSAPWPGINCRSCR